MFDNTHFDKINKRHIFSFLTNYMKRNIFRIIFFLSFLASCGSDHAKTEAILNKSLDSLSVSEYVNVLVPIIYISSFDSVLVTEYLSFNPTSYINVYDSSTVYDYDKVVEFTKSFDEAGEHQINLKVGYNK